MSLENVIQAEGTMDNIVGAETTAIQRNEDVLLRALSVPENLSAYINHVNKKFNTTYRAGTLDEHAEFLYHITPKMNEAKEFLLAKYDHYSAGITKIAHRYAAIFNEFIDTPKEQRENFDVIKSISALISSEEAENQLKDASRKSNYDQRMFGSHYGCEAIPEISFGDIARGVLSKAKDSGKRFKDYVAGKSVRVPEKLYNQAALQPTI